MSKSLPKIKRFQVSRTQATVLTRPPYCSLGAGRIRPWTSVIVLLTLMPNVFRNGSALKFALCTWKPPNESS